MPIGINHLNNSWRGQTNHVMHAADPVIHSCVNPAEAQKMIHPVHNAYVGLAYETENLHQKAPDVIQESEQLLAALSKHPHSSHHKQSLADRYPPLLAPLVWVRRQLVEESPARHKPHLIHHVPFYIFFNSGSWQHFPTGPLLFSLTSDDGLGVCIGCHPPDIAKKPSLNQPFQARLSDDTFRVLLELQPKGTLDVGPS